MASPRRIATSLITSLAFAALALGCGSSSGGSSGSASTAPASTTTTSGAATPGSTTIGTPTPGTTTPGTTTTAPVVATPAPSPSPRAPTGTTVLVVCGLSQEQQAAQGSNVQIVLSDSDPVHLQSVLAGTSPAPLGAVVSFGIGGGLNPAYSSGQVMIATRVIAPGGQWTALSGTWVCDPTLVARLQTGLQAGGINVQVGVEAGSDSLTQGNSPQAKAALRALTGADQVDMESHIAADWAQRNGLPFVVLRAVSDDSNTTLPPAALLPLNSSGSASIGSILGSLLGNPGQIGGLLQAYTQSNSAFNALTQCNQVFPLGGL